MYTYIPTAHVHVCTHTYPLHNPSLARQATPSFFNVAREKSGRAWYLKSRAWHHDDVTKEAEKVTRMAGRCELSRQHGCLISTWLEALEPYLCPVVSRSTQNPVDLWLAHSQLRSLYGLSTLYVTHVTLDTSPTSFSRVQRWKSWVWPGVWG